MALTTNDLRAVIREEIEQFAPFDYTLDVGELTSRIISALDSEGAFDTKDVNIATRNDTLRDYMASHRGVINALTPQSGDCPCHMCKRAKRLTR